jgi:hypothetical protein
MREQPSSELEASGPRCVGESLHTSVKKKAVPVENYLRQASRDGSLCYSSPDTNCTTLVPRVLTTKVGLEGVGSHEGTASHIIDKLGVNVGRRTKHGQPWTLGGTTNPLADVRLTANPTGAL